MGIEPATVTLGAAATVLTGHPFPSSNFSASANGPRLLRGDNVAQGVLRWDGCKYWPQSSCEGLEQFELRAGDVILAMDRPWIEAGLKYAAVTVSDLPALLVQRVARLRAREGYCQDFLRYVLGAKAFTDYILGVQTGTSVPHISKGQIEEFEFDCPPFPTQQRIAAILGALDDKIDLNRRMHRTLEAMASALFKSWQEETDADEVVASELISAGVLQINDGYRAKNSELGSVGPPFARAGNVQQGFVFRDADRVRPESVGRAGEKVSRPFDAVFTSKGTVGRIALVLPSTETFVYSPQLCFWRSVDHARLHPLVLFQWMRSRDFIEQIDVLKGQTDMADYVNLRDQRDMTIMLSLGPAQTPLVDKLVPIIDRCSAMDRESRTLAALRDTLLPKLLSGEVTLREAERAVGKVA